MIWLFKNYSAVLTDQACRKTWPSWQIITRFVKQFLLDPTKLCVIIQWPDFIRFIKQYTKRENLDYCSERIIYLQHFFSGKKFKELSFAQVLQSLPSDLILYCFTFKMLCSCYFSCEDNKFSECVLVYTLHSQKISCILYKVTESFSKCSWKKAAKFLFFFFFLPPSSTYLCTYWNNFTLRTYTNDSFHTHTAICNCSNWMNRISKILSS